MNLPSALPEARKPSVGSAVFSTLRSIVAAASDRGTALKAELPPYSFLSECECPDHCNRDHENE